MDCHSLMGIDLDAINKLRALFIVYHYLLLHRRSHRLDTGYGRGKLEPEGPKIEAEGQERA